MGGHHLWKDIKNKGLSPERVARIEAAAVAEVARIRLLERLKTIGFGVFLVALLGVTVCSWIFAVTAMMARLLGGG